MKLATLSEKEIIITLIALALLLIMAFVFGTLMELIKGPRVVGEILGGMIISLEFFTVLILTTMLSSMIAGYYLRLQQKRDSKVFDEL